MRLSRRFGSIMAVVNVNLRIDAGEMVDIGMLKMSDVNIVWQSGRIPNGPWAMGTALPASRKKDSPASCWICRKRIVTFTTR